MKKLFLLAILSLSLVTRAASTLPASYTPAPVVGNTYGTAVVYGRVSRFDTYIDPDFGPDWTGSYEGTNYVDGGADTVTLTGLQPGATYYVSAFTYDSTGYLQPSDLCEEVSYTLSITNIITVDISDHAAKIQQVESTTGGVNHQWTVEPDVTFPLCLTNAVGTKFFRALADRPITLQVTQQAQ